MIPSQVINIDSDPKGGKIKATDLHREATTPTAYLVYKGPLKDINVRIEKEGYVSQEAVLSKRVTPSYWINILNGWGFLVDFVTGAMWNYQDTVYMKLEPIPSDSQAQ